MTAPEATHTLELVCPLYGSKGAHTTVCTCGWASDEHPTPGQATLAGWAHIREHPAEEKVS